MARLINRKSAVEIKDGASMLSGAEDLGIPLGCFVGMCGVCQVNVLEGEENLSSMTRAEKDMELKGGVRLACQAKVKSGTVRIKF